MRVIRSAIRSGGRRDHFRVIEFSVQSNHIHLIVEASGSDGLTRGMIGLEVRIARRVNRVLDRAGRLFADRYHSRSLRTPTEVRAAIRYVLDNHRHHADGNSLRRAGLDPCSSAVWFGGWATRLQARERWHEQLLAEGRPTASPTVWLLTVGWRRLGPLCLTELGADRTLPPSARSHPR